MPSPDPDDLEGLPPPGSRWGAGARSVLPYLTRSLQARPANTPEARDGKPRDGRSREPPVLANWPSA